MSDLLNRYLISHHTEIGIISFYCLPQRFCLAWQMLLQWSALLALEIDVIR